MSEYATCLYSLVIYPRFIIANRTTAKEAGVQGRNSPEYIENTPLYIAVNKSNFIINISTRVIP